MARRSTKVDTETIKVTGKSDFQKRVDQRVKAYEKDYNVEELNDSNDKALLFTLIRSELILEDLQTRIQEVLEEKDIVEAAGEIKKLSDLIRDLTTQVTTIQKTLNIDRKSRKEEQTDNVADYLRGLKTAAKSFMEKRLIKVYCTDCKVMVARFSPVHNHTAFSIRMQCDQCKKFIIAKRDERDIWFDIKPADAQWRRKYPAEIIQPTTKEDYIADGGEDDLLITPVINITETPEIELEKIEYQSGEVIPDRLDLSDPSF